TAGLRRQDWSFFGRADCRGYVLDLALGPNRASAFDSDDGLLGGPRPARAAAPIPQRDARHRAGADAGGDVLPAHSGERSRGSDRASRGVREEQLVDRIFRRGCDTPLWRERRPTATAVYCRSKVAP